MKKLAYSTQQSRSRSELRKHLKAILKELISQEFINKDTGLRAEITQRDINKIASDEAIRKSEANNYTQEEHFKVAEDIAPLYENATLKEKHQDHKERENITGVYRFHIDIEVNGKDTTAKITALERKEGVNRIYTIELKELNPPPYVSSVKETEVAKSLSSDTAPHNDLSIYCDSDKGNSTKESAQSQTKPKLRRR